MRRSVPGILVPSASRFTTSMSPTRSVFCIEPDVMTNVWTKKVRSTRKSTSATPDGLRPFQSATGRGAVTGRRIPFRVALRVAHFVACFLRRHRWRRERRRVLAKPRPAGPPEGMEVRASRAVGYRRTSGWLRQRITSPIRPQRTSRSQGKGR